MSTAGNAIPSSRDTAHLLLRDLPPSLAARLRGLHGKAPVWNLVCVFYPLAWIATAATVERLTAGKEGVLPWLVRITGVALIGVFIQAIAILMHEALHGNLFRSTRLNSWAIFLCGVPAFFSGSAYKVAHLNHHRHTRTEQDQDEISNLSSLCKTPAQYRALVNICFLAGTLIYLSVVLPWTAMQIGTSSQRRQIVLEYAVMFVLYAGVIIGGISAGHANWLLWYWILPIQVAMFLSNIRGVSEHLCTSTDSVLSMTRTTRSNALVSFLMCNLNYHLEHHLFPGVPWYNLQKVHKELQSVYARSRPFVERSYTRYAVKALFRGPFREIRDISVG